MLIAATALQHSLVMVTANQREFDRISGYRLTTGDRDEVLMKKLTFEEYIAYNDGTDIRYELVDGNSRLD